MTTDSLERRIRLAEAAQRYYVEGWSQDQVAGFLQTSRSNVSRLLETARKEGVIRFVVDHPLKRHRALETALEPMRPRSLRHLLDFLPRRPHPWPTSRPAPHSTPAAWRSGVPPSRS